MWELIYDASSRGFYFYPYRADGSVEIYTGANSVPAPGTWMQLEIRYDAATNGGAQLYIDGQTQGGLGAEGNFERPNAFAILQLWNDGPGTWTSTMSSSPARHRERWSPGAPTDVETASAMARPWCTGSAPIDDGGSPISGYRITPYIERRRADARRPRARPRRART